MEGVPPVVAPVKEDTCNQVNVGTPRGIVTLLASSCKKGCD